VKKIFYLVIATVTGGGNISSNAQQAAMASSRAIVRIHPVGGFGESITSVAFQLHRLDDGQRSIVLPVKGDVANNVPYGTYSLEGENRSIIVAKKLVVEAPDVFVTIGVPLPPLDGDVRGLDGDAMRLVANEHPMWVGLLGVFLDERFETRVSRDGKFSFRGVPSGLYVLTVLNDQGIILLRQVSIRSGVQRVSLANQ
jgi:hypothetical protein